MHKISIDTSIDPVGIGGAKDEAIILIEKAVSAAVAEFAPEGEYEVSILVTGDEQIRKLNYEYRDIDSPTDVLSFPQLEGEDSESAVGLASLLGDIVISAETAIRQAEEYGHSLERELAFLSIHGALHLLGFDHEQDEDRAEMRLAEEALLDSLGLPRIA